MCYCCSLPLPPLDVQGIVWDLENPLQIRVLTVDGLSDLVAMGTTVRWKKDKVKGSYKKKAVFKTLPVSPSLVCVAMEATAITTHQVRLGALGFLGCQSDNLGLLRRASDLSHRKWKFCEHFLSAEP